MLRTLTCAIGSTYILFLTGCGSGPPPPVEITHVEPGFEEALRTGFSVAPVDRSEPIYGGAESLAEFTNGLYSSLLAFTEGVEITEPGVVLKRVKHGGDEALALFRKFQRERINKLPLSTSDCTRIFPLVLQRFLFVPWVEEHEEAGVEDTVSGEYTTKIDFAADLNNVSFKQYEGQLSGEMIDLVKGEVVWRGVARYKTGKIFIGNRPEDLWACRTKAATNLARLLSLD